METPVFDFVQEYVRGKFSRFHMPGHKGFGPLGVEALDITEVAGADSLYEAEGILRESEKNAASLFGTWGSFYSTEGSSHVIRAMLFLALARWRENYGEAKRPVVVAARNAHKAFLTAAALLDLDVVWLWGRMPQERTLAACPVSGQEVKETLESLCVPPVAVYVTSPDYLGGMLDIRAIAGAAHAAGTLLLVDNAHGAYLHFLPTPLHPMDVGADLCCDSAHKTLPVLTGGAYLHVARRAGLSFGNGEKETEKNVRQALALFGSTSPSYLTLQSLDLANQYLAKGYRERLSACIKNLEAVRLKLQGLGWAVEGTEPLKLTLATARCGYLGGKLSEIFRAGGVECEYADPDFLVFMVTPENTAEDFLRLSSFAGKLVPRPGLCRIPPPFLPPRQKISIREAVFSPQEYIPVEKACGRVMGAVTVHCPPAIPVVVSGEEIAPDVLPVFQYYGICEVCVTKTGTSKKNA